MNIKNGENIWFSSEIIRLALIFRQNGEILNVDDLIDEIIERLGKDGTLMIPVFSYEFSNEGTYDYLHTRGTAGAVGNKVLARKDFKRTKHPIHSFAVWGKDKDMLCEMDNKHSFGLDSPFEYCRKNEVRQIMLGTDYAHALTMVHFCESVCNVPYRFTKIFTGEYTDEFGETKVRSYDYAARDRSIKTINKFNEMGRILEEAGASVKSMFYGCPCYSVQLNRAYDLICNDILCNKCQNIYDFDVDRDSMFKGFGENK